MKRQLIVLTLFLSAAMMSGCASSLNVGESSFACKEAGGCPTPIEVYESTHGAPSELRVGKTPKAWKSDPSQTVVRIQESVAQATPAKEAIGAKTIRVDAARTVVPLRSSSSVLRIWIAPWVDENDRLNWARYSFVEVSPRTWRFGENEVRKQDDVPFVNIAPDVDPGVNRR